MLAAIYWWHTHYTLFLLVPLITGLAKNFKIWGVLIFFSMATYCLILEHAYKSTQKELLGHHQSLIIHVDDIQHNELKNASRIAGTLKLKESQKSAQVQIFSKEKLSINCGDFIECKNILFKEPHNKDYKKYLLKEYVHGTTYITRAQADVLGHQESFANYIKRQLYWLESKMTHKISKVTATLLSSLFLGSKRYSQTDDSEIKDYFNTWGINHFLARSGLHVTLILFLVAFMGRLLLIPYNYLNPLTGVFLLLYSLFSYSSTSFLRAFITALAAIWCAASRVPINPLHIVTLTFLMVLAYNPFLALFLDFQLTFLLTWGLCILTLLDF